jgi:heme/copper-type cytochrome/quinol oxidase subunit 2
MHQECTYCTTSPCRLHNYGLQECAIEYTARRVVIIIVIIIIIITIIPVIIGATGIVTKSLRKSLEVIPREHSIDSLR